MKAFPVLPYPFPRLPRRRYRTAGCQHLPIPAPMMSSVNLIVGGPDADARGAVGRPVAVTRRAR
jgi:hypothetical protein